MNISLSVVVTILNEEKSLKGLLSALKLQTLVSGEIILVDAGSTDNTLALIQEFQANNPDTNINLIIAKGSNRSIARNKGIDAATNQIIAITDAGCIPHPDWLQLITQPLINDQAESVAGFYQPIIKTAFHQTIAPYLATMPDKFNPKTYLPSSRSVAFTKIAWKKAAKYPEALNYCEDLVFARNLKTKTNMIVEPKAIVDWQIPANLIDYFTAIKNYAHGDVQAKYSPHLRKIISVYLRYLLFLVLPPVFILYLIYPLIKQSKYIKDLSMFITLPLIQIVTDTAIITGSLQAFSQEILSHRSRMT